MKHKPGVIVTGISILILFTQLTTKQEQEFDLKASIERGKELYITYCLTCHMEDGLGMVDLYPPLAKADYLMEDKKRSIQQVLYGVDTIMKVNGETYNLEMKGFDFTDEQTSDVLNYVRNSWGNEGEAVLPDEVKDARKNTEVKEVNEEKE